MAKRKSQQKDDRLKRGTWLIIEGERWEIFHQAATDVEVFDHHGRPSSTSTVTDFRRRQMVYGGDGSAASLGKAIMEVLLDAWKRADELEEKKRYLADPEKYIEELKERDEASGAASPKASPEFLFNMRLIREHDIVDSDQRNGIICRMRQRLPSLDGPAFWAAALAVLEADPTMLPTAG